MKYVIYAAHIPVQALNLHCKTTYINLPLKPFKIIFALLFQGEIVNFSLNFYQCIWMIIDILAHFRMMVGADCNTVNRRWNEGTAKIFLCKISAAEVDLKPTKIIILQRIS